jgi:putative ABC transport system permease protein
LLMVAEVALAMVLLSGAGILIQGLVTELSAHPGFNAKGLLTGNMLLAGRQYFAPIPGDLKRVTPQVASFYGQLLDQIWAIPGVTAAAMISRMPTDGWLRQPFTILGQAPQVRAAKQEADYVEVDSALFRTLGLAVVRGRGIEEHDVEGAPWVAVVNRTFAERYFPGADPLGKAIRVSIRSGSANVTVSEEQPREIVGVVDNLRYPAWEREPVAAMYVSYRQHPSEYPGGDYRVHVGKTLVIRTVVEPMSLAPALRRAVAEVDRNQVLESVMTAEQRIAESLSENRFAAQLFGAFGTLALLLAAVGIFGVTAYLVNQRMPEFGIRIALGARRGDIVRLLLSQLGLLLGAGTALGAAGGYAIQAMLRRGLIGLTPAGAATWSAVVCIMFGAAFLATWLPLRRAMRTDPIAALRQ